ncbi:late secretory pathway protein AVL9-like [Cucumis melo var. makuwa]|uniref:Late secretory pathway protein AVL9-like n=1 Tax=Cucumis melo var. makuwa TaxID=1194695 RepID=A0A5D3CKU5_CUCMM|nr:late secretory pathway protein AVL9-like [Cucumis melo var. makuwa]TYK12175.1 late secretory pathway protein AVL9-like [Cucumis melo var. makuwa]
MHVKVLNGWNNKSFDMLLEILKRVFPMCRLDVEPTMVERSIMRHVVEDFITMMMNNYPFKADQMMTNHVICHSFPILMRLMHFLISTPTSSITQEARPRWATRLMTLNLVLALLGDDSALGTWIVPSNYSKGLGWGPKPKSRKTVDNSSSSSYKQEVHAREVIELEGHLDNVTELHERAMEESNWKYEENAR